MERWPQRRRYGRLGSTGRSKCKVQDLCNTFNLQVVTGKFDSFQRARLPAETAELRRTRSGDVCVALGVELREYALWRSEGRGCPGITSSKDGRLTRRQWTCNIKRFNKLAPVAGVAELADAQDLGSCGVTPVEVQLLSPAPILTC